MHPVYSLSHLETKADSIRQDIIKMLTLAKSGHSAGALGMADVFTALYFAVMTYNPQQPLWEARDRLVLSCGHICPVLYTTLAHAGYFDHEELWTLRQLGSRLQGHPSRLHLPGVEVSSGPLGQGYSQAVGMALALQLTGNPAQVFCIASDGEHNEGQVWEAVLLAAKYALPNLTVIVDRNHIQIDGFTEEVMPLESLARKYEAFGWHVVDIDGHNLEAIIDACHEAKAMSDKPVVIIAHTIPGKGVDFMQWKPEWHGKPPNSVQAVKALRQLRTLQGVVAAEHD